MIYRIRDLRLSFADMAHKPLLGAAPRIKVLKGLSFGVPKGAVLGIVGTGGRGISDQLLRWIA